MYPTERIIEPLLVYGCAYASYLIAEMLELSSILAIVFCGFFMQSYVEHNIRNEIKTGSISGQLKMPFRQMIFFIISDFWFL